MSDRGKRRRRNRPRRRAGRSASVAPSGLVPIDASNSESQRTLSGQSDGSYSPIPFIGAGSLLASDEFGLKHLKEHYFSEATRLRSQVYAEPDSIGTSDAVSWTAAEKLIGHIEAGEPTSDAELRELKRWYETVRANLARRRRDFGAIPFTFS
jgi:hypothetical protein